MYTLDTETAWYYLFSMIVCNSCANFKICLLTMMIHLNEFLIGHCIKYDIMRNI